MRTTRYEYTDDGWLKKLKSDNTATGQQVTEWVYGVDPAKGSALYSNRLVYQKKYPDRRKRSVGGTLDETKFVLKDYLDPTAIINSTGTVDERFSYDAFGPVRFLDASFVPLSGNTSAFAWTFLFHAEFLDTDSGLYNYGFRFYHPYLGRWLSRDPIGEQGGMNLYGMVANAAVTRIDYLGLFFPPGSNPFPGVGPGMAPLPTPPPAENDEADRDLDNENN